MFKEMQEFLTFERFDLGLFYFWLSRYGRSGIRCDQLLLDGMLKRGV